MLKFVMTLLGIVAVLAFSLYATLGETGPIGWFNAAQARGNGSYSRGLSAIGLMLSTALLVLAIVHVFEFLLKAKRALFGPARPKAVADKAPAAPLGSASTAAATFARAAPAAPTPAAAPAKAASPAPSGWRLGLIVWATFNALVWACLLAWYGWDWHLRRVDVVSTYASLALNRGVAPVRPDDGSHLALQGVPLWDHAVSRRPSNGSGKPDAIYVPVAPADWRSGDPVYFIAQFDREQQLYDVRRAAGNVDGPVLVRVDGAAAAAARPVFERDGVPVADTAVRVTAIPSQAGRPMQADPAFDWMDVNLIGGILTGLFTVLPLAGVLGLKREEWMARRREARRRSGKTA